MLFFSFCTALGGSFQKRHSNAGKYQPGLMQSEEKGAVLQTVFFKPSGFSETLKVWNDWMLPPDRGRTPG
jgi:hypothetical protein